MAKWYKQKETWTAYKYENMFNFPGKLKSERPFHVHELTKEFF